MTAPVIGTTTFDKALYNPGDTVTLTVSYTPGSSAPPPSSVAVHGTGTDVPSGETAEFDTTYMVQSSAPAADATSWAITDSAGHTWTQVSDNGSVAVFTSTA